VAPPPLVEGAARPRPILAWAGLGLPASAARPRDAVYAFLEYASRPDVDREVTAGSQNYSPMDASNDAIENPVAREFLPLFDDAIPSIDWLWEPEITAEIDSQVQALVKGATDAAAAARAVQTVAEDLRASGRSYYP
jgi:ABC-type glycerol-3-phosphate transport system substrate-binding protein